MPHANPSDADLTALLTHATTIAMIGTSPNPETPSRGIMRRLQEDLPPKKEQR